VIWDLIHITSNKKPVLIPNFNLSLIVTIVSDMNTCCLGHLTFGRFPPTRKQFIHVCTVPSGCKKFNTGNRIYIWPNRPCQFRWPVQPIIPFPAGPFAATRYTYNSKLTTKRISNWQISTYACRGPLFHFKGVVYVKKFE